MSPDSHPDKWEAARRGELGISCVAMYDTATERVHTYIAKPWRGLTGPDAWDSRDLMNCVKHLNQADVLVGFNSIGFDTPALQEFSSESIYPEQYDILHHIWAALPKKIKGYGLDPVCKRLGLGSKTETGAFAPELYKTGLTGRLIDYCIGDVALTRKLANHINTFGTITTPEGDELEVKALGIEV